MPLLSMLRRLLSGRCRLSWLLLAAACLAEPAAAQTYTVTSTAFTWDSVATASGVSGDDVASGAVTMGAGFSFPMGGVNYTQVYFNSNGLVTLGSSSTAYANVALPSSAIPAVSLAAFWDDLRSDTAGSSITYGLSGSAPNRRFVISYNAITLYGNANLKYTFQVALFEDGSIEYRYDTMSTGASATVGVQLSLTDATNFTGTPAIATMARQTLRWVSRESSTPGGVDGHVWWSRAGTLTGTVADGGAISTWANAANYAKNLTAGTTKPVLANNNSRNLNFNPLVGFTSVTATAAGAQYFSAPSLMGSTSHNQTHAFVVAYPTASASRNYLFWEGQINGRLSSSFPWSDGKVWWVAGDWTDRTASYTPATSLTNQPLLFSMLKDATTNVATLSGRQGVRQNGVVVSTLASSAAFTGNNTPFYLGWQAVETGSATFQGYLAEGILMLDRVLTSTEINKVESYLSVKYGLTLGANGATSTAYLDSGGSTVWTSNTGYHYNVTGIARDDTTMLDQRISRSSNSGSQITVISNASMPSSGSLISAQAGTAFTADKAYVVWGDNNGDTAGTLPIASGSMAGYVRGVRVWRVQATGAAPASTVLCIPDALIPASLLSLSSLQLTLSTAADFATGTTNLTLTAGNCPGSGVGVTASVPGRLATVAKATLEAGTRVAYLALTARQLDHIEITTSVSSGVTCAPVTFTIKACGDAACSSTYTGGMTGTLTITGTGMTVNYPSGSGFAIASGSSTTTIQAQVTTAGTVTVGATALSLAPSNAKPVFCGIGVAATSSTTCNLVGSASGFLFDLPNHRSGVGQTVTLQAIKQADNSPACAPVLNGAKSINFKCSYMNPGTGTLPILVGGGALNAAGNAAAACDATGASRSVTFDANGAASIAVQYNDVGQMRLSATYTGSGPDAGLVITGSDDFIAAPYDFAVTGIPASLIAAGNTFAATVTARNFAGGTTPNFGREAVAEGAVIGFVRSQPLGSGAVSGTFSGSLGSFSAGAATTSDLSWTEVGKGNVSARLNSGSYLSTGMTLAGSSEGALVACASEGGNCVLPTGATATMYYGAAGRVAVLAGLSGTVACNNTTFGDPNVGVAKSCNYVATSGTRTASFDAASFKPHHFDVTTSAACGSFSYAGQPFGATVTARNASGATTLNYDGGANTSPNMARVVTFSEGSGNATGALSGTAMAASAFASGVGVNTSVAFAFTNKLTVPQTIALRATDTDGVSSSGYAEGSMALRSGRLRLSNAFGSAAAPLQIPVAAEYWLNQAWVPNAADDCTVVPNASIALSNPRNASGGLATATTSAAGVALVAGSAKLVLAAPTPAGSSLTLDLAINLGSTAADQSCQNNHPATTGAARPWLRSFNGACAATADRDPAARASFGIFSPENRKTVHVRDLY